MKLSNEAIQKRQQIILSAIREQTVVYVEELSKLLNVSEITIRRDLKTFEEQNLIERFHGGARLLEGKGVAANRGRQQIHNCEKQLIARAGAELVRDGDTIFMSSSTTAMFVLDHLQNKRIRVITNNTLTTQRDYGPNIEVILTGGEHNYERQSLHGDFAIDVLNKTRASRCLMGANGVCPVHGITTTVYSDSPVNRRMLAQCSGERILLADGSKIGFSDGFVYGSITDIHTLVTDKTADEKVIHAIRNKGVNVIVVGED